MGVDAHSECELRKTVEEDLRCSAPDERDRGEEKEDELDRAEERP